MCRIAFSICFIEGSLFLAELGECREVHRVDETDCSIFLVFSAWAVLACDVALEILILASRAAHAALLLHERVDGAGRACRLVGRADRTEGPDAALVVGGGAAPLA